MEKTEHNDQLEISTFGFDLANVANMRRFMQPGPEHQALYGHIFRDTFWLVLGRGYRRKCHKHPRGRGVTRQMLSSLVLLLFSRIAVEVALFVCGLD